jgi:hypothetical protein
MTMTRHLASPPSRLLLSLGLSAALIGCKGSSLVDPELEDVATSDADAGACSGGLFGRPSEHTGLDSSQCEPRCTCGGSIHEAPVFDAARLAALRAWTLLDPPAVPTSDPYVAGNPAPASSSTVCAVLTDSGSGTYRLGTFDTSTAALDAGGVITHRGPCGLCSTLEDLAVYAEVTDLTTPVRACGLLGLTDGFDVLLACVEDIGFSSPCAHIWAYNVEHTRARCFEPCVALLDAPYHLPDGGLNPCLRCDEGESGPVFQSVAGRTRRNTGIASALCRPCSEILPLQHEYGGG